MRMTNKIMQSNSLYNINQNKVLQDKLSTQMSTQKKLTRPSDDPVVAIRALRLRSSVSELNQYYEKNAPDAESWLDVTSDGLSTVTDILTDLSKNATKGANKDLTPDDINIIVTQMESLSEEFYSTGNLDYAGRYVFTGFRTDTPMQFTTADVSDTINPVPSYNIWEQGDLDGFDTVNYTHDEDLDNITASNVTDYDVAETSIYNADIKRYRLAYDDIKGSDLTFGIYTEGSDGKYTATVSYTPTSYTKDEAYETIAKANEAGEEAVVYCKDTGEVLFSDKAYESFKSAYETAEKAGTKVEVRANYTKENWSNGDLRPEHYFACTSTDSNGKSVSYNTDYLDDLYENKTRQTIAYDVGYNQTIEINTTADEVFTHDLKRDIDDLQTALDDLLSVYQSKTAVEEKYKSMSDTDADYEAVVRTLDAITKSYDYVRENMHTKLEQAIDKMQSYLDATNVAVTDNGTRSSRLELISNRLMDQTTTFETLQSENEDVDISEVAIQLSSSELTYEASLMATSKIMQTTLMNYI